MSDSKHILATYVYICILIYMCEQNVYKLILKLTNNNQWCISDVAPNKPHLPLHLIAQCIYWQHSIQNSVARSISFKCITELHNSWLYSFCLLHYHIELFPHGAPVSQSHCHLRDDWLLRRDDRFKLPVGDKQKNNHCDVDYFSIMESKKHLLVF